MYIQPNSTVRILKDVPLTPDYKDTLYFASEAEQRSYFIGKTAVTLTSLSYVRKERGVIKAEVKADRIYSAGYLMYQNTSYGGKWFYAFITGIEYDNENTAIITFQIDDLQTWYFDYSTPPCLVERCHSRTDDIGDNIVPEPVDPGDMVPNSYIEIHKNHLLGELLDEPVLAVSFIDPEGHSPDGKLVNRVFTTGDIYVFDLATDAGVEAASDWLNDVSAQYFDSIVGMWMIPRWTVGAGLFPSIMSTSRQGLQYTHELPRLTSSSPLDGYVPKNNKLYTYPYNLLQVTTATGSQMAVKYEFFNSLTPTFQETWNLPDPVSSVLRPTNYHGISASAKDMCLTLQGYPMAMWSGDAYKAWLAQSKASLVGTLMTMLGGLLLAPVTGGASVAATIGAGVNLLAQNHQASIAADMRGGGSSGSNAWSNDQMDYYASRMSCTYDKARMIDDYFTAFGYACGEIMRPPTHNRKSFTYVKTDGCIVKGDLPSEAAAKIRSIYDAGIRFWADHGNFGNLAIDNYTLA